MKKAKFSDSQIISILKQGSAGTPVAEVLRERGISSATFYKWRSKYGGMDLPMMTRLKELEQENARCLVPIENGILQRHKIIKIRVKH